MHSKPLLVCVNKKVQILRGFPETSETSPDEATAMHCMKSCHLMSGRGLAL